MSDYIPIEVYSEILSRLPMVDLLRYRQVCKEWRSLIDDDAEFAKLQFDRSKTHEHDEDNMMLTISTDTGKLYSVGVSSINCAQGRRTKNLDINSFNVPFFIRNLPVSFCHSLVLHRSSQVVPQSIWSLCNICNGEYVNLPSSDEFRFRPSVRYCSGIGYDTSTNDYKVVIIYADFVGDNTRDKIIRSSIYSLNSRYWRRIDDFDGCRDLETPTGVFANGSLHWIGNGVDGISAWCIIALDLKTETYRAFTLPTEIRPSMWSRTLFEEPGGCLCVSATNYPLHLFALWMLEKYGEDQYMWVRVLLLELPRACNESWDVRAIAYMKTTQQVVIAYKKFKLVWYDVENDKCVKKVTNMGRGGPFTYQVLPASLLKRSPDDSLELKLKITGSTVPWYE